MSNNNISYKDFLREALKDNEEAAAFLNAALEENDIDVFKLACRDIVDE